jgi:hypothetical protein
MPNQKPEPINRLIRETEAVLTRAGLKKDDQLVLRASECLGDLYAKKAQMAMGVDEQKALRSINDGALIAEVKRRGLSLDSQVVFRVVHDASPDLSDADADLPAALPESSTDSLAQESRENNGERA